MLQEEGVGCVSVPVMQLINTVYQLSWETKKLGCKFFEKKVGKGEQECKEEQGNERK